MLQNTQNQPQNILINTKEPWCHTTLISPTVQSNLLARRGQDLLSPQCSHICALKRNLKWIQLQTKSRNRTTKKKQKKPKRTKKSSTTRKKKKERTTLKSFIIFIKAAESYYTQQIFY